MKLEHCKGPARPAPRQRSIPEESYRVCPKTGVITDRRPTGKTFTRHEWAVRGWFFPRWGQTTTLARA